jgi:AcrR family transcriptional regulator
MLDLLGICYHLVYQMVTNVTERRPPRSRLAGPERRALIEAAAARLFAERGFQATTVQQIVAAAGVSKPMLYRHFESKLDLATRMMERRRDELAAAPLDAFIGSGEGPRSLAAMLDAWFAHVEEHPDSSRLLFQDVTGEEQLRGLQQELRARQRAADVALLRELVPGLPEEQLEPLGEIIRSSLTGLALWWLANPGVPRRVVSDAMLRVTRGLVVTPS